MPSVVFDDLLTKGIRAGQVPARTKDARKWFRQQAKATKISTNNFMKNNRDKLVGLNNIAVGKMYFFNYDPKYKATLPYYDRFPLIFPIENYPKGFLGINMHYLPLPLRAKLMDALYGLVNNNRFDESTRLTISYSILKSAAKYRYFKPCIKHYLNAHVRSRFLRVEPVEWDIALYLPVAQFDKASQAQVWKDSRRMIMGGR